MKNSRLLVCLAIVAGTVVIAMNLSASTADDSAAGTRASTVSAEAQAREPVKSSSAAKEESELGAPEKAKPITEVQTDLAIWTFAVFVVLLAILWKFAWGPIVAGLAKRELGIADNIAAAQRAHEEAKLLLVEYERKLAGAAEQVRVMLEEARKEAEQAKVQIIAEAKEAAKLEFERSRRELQRATDQALKELSERATNLAIDLAGKIVRAQLSQADHARLVQEAMAEFAASSPRAN